MKVLLHEWFRQELEKWYNAPSFTKSWKIITDNNFLTILQFLTLFSFEKQWSNAKCFVYIKWKLMLNLSFCCDDEIIY